MDNNSCVMLAVGLYTPVDLIGIFDTDDLEGTGIEVDSHITILYAKDKMIPREGLLSSIQDILGDEDYSNMISALKNDNFKDVLEFFELGSFENESDYIVLKLRHDTDLYDYLRTINKGLRGKFNVKSDYSSYEPHITLAQLKSGYASKYLSSEKLKLVLKDTKFDLEDFMLSQGDKTYFLTQFNNVDRFFRLERLRKSNSGIEEE